VDNDAVAREIAAVGREDKKPLLVNLMTDRRQWTGPANILSEAGVPIYGFPETAARALAAMARYRRMNSRQPGAVKTYADLDGRAASAILDRALAAGREFLTQEEGYRLLEAAGIPSVGYLVACSPREATSAAEKLGLPVVLKVDSPHIIHKSDASAVALDLKTPLEFSRALDSLSSRFSHLNPAYLVQKFMPGITEVVVGASAVPGLGHLILFGLGGIFVEILGDFQLELTPVSDREAREMVTGIRSFRLLAGARGRKPANLDSLYEIILRTSQMLTFCPGIAELDLNPVLASESGAFAADVRIRLAPR
jgi:acetyltransferase